MNEYSKLKITNRSRKKVMVLKSEEKEPVGDLISSRQLERSICAKAKSGKYLGKERVGQGVSMLLKG